MKRVWILNHYAGDMFAEKGGRHYSLAKYMKKAGLEPVIFCADSKHNSDAEKFVDVRGLWTERQAREIEVPFVFVKTRTYKGNRAGRILNMTDFYQNVRLAAAAYAVRNGRPDMILASSVHPLTLLAGLSIAKEFGVKCICEIRDLWPESIVVYMNRFSRHNLLIRALYRGERYIYEKADALIFTMEGGYQYICDKRWQDTVPVDKVHIVNNGIDGEAFTQNRTAYPADDPDLNDKEKFNVVYAGSIRHVNDLGALLDIAGCVRDPRVRFLIWGDGDELPALKERAEREDLRNLVFKGRTDKKYIPDIVSRADLNIAHNKPSEIFRYGISFNKLFDYFAAKRPVLCDFPSDYNPAVIWETGPVPDRYDPVGIAGAIDRLASAGPEEYVRYCRNATAAAEEYDYRNLAGRLIGIMQELYNRK